MDLGEREDRCFVKGQAQDGFRSLPPGDAHRALAGKGRDEFFFGPPAPRNRLKRLDPRKESEGNGMERNGRGFGRAGSFRPRIWRSFAALLKTAQAVGRAMLSLAHALPGRPASVFDPSLAEGQAPRDASLAQASGFPCSLSVSRWVGKTKFSRCDGQTLENAQNGNGWLLQELGMDSPSAPHRLGSAPLWPCGRVSFPRW